MCESETVVERIENNILRKVAQNCPMLWTFQIQVYRTDFEEGENSDGVINTNICCLRIYRAKCLYDGMAED